MRSRFTFCCAALLLPASMPASAAVTFVFDYSHPSNTTDFGSGAFFDGSPMGTARKAALAATAAEMGGLLDHTATVTVFVTTSFAPAGKLASGGPAYYVPPTASGVVLSAMESQIIMGAPPPVFMGGPPPGAHAGLNVNAAKPFYTGADPLAIPSGFFDLRSVVWHELTHAMGWGSAVLPDHTSSLTDTLKASAPAFYAGLGELFTKYDTTLVDAGSLPALLMPAGTVNPAFDHSGGVFLAGPHVLDIGEMISTATTPLSYDTTHLAGSVDSIMDATLPPGTTERGWTTIDKAVLEDIGYSFAAIPEPALLAPLLGIAALTRRRRAIPR